jgi:hypothetical protein
LKKFHVLLKYLTFFCQRELIFGGFWQFGTTVHRLSSLSQVNAGSADHQYHQQRRRAAAAPTHSATAHTTTASSSLKRRIIGGR